MKELWYEFLQWYEANGIEEIITWAAGIFVIIYTTISRLSLNKSKLREISTVAKNKNLEKDYDNIVAEVRKENEELKLQLSQLVTTAEKLVAMNFLILDNARLDLDIKQRAKNIMNYDTGSKQFLEVKEAVKNVLEETIETVTEKIEKNNTVGDYDPLVDSLLKKAKGQLNDGRE